MDSVGYIYILMHCSNNKKIGYVFEGAEVNMEGIGRKKEKRNGIKIH